MKTILNKENYNEIVQRIETLNENATAEWGKMNVSEMIQHCVTIEKMYLGKTKVPRVFVGYLFGRMALKSVLKNDKPFQKGTPTLKEAKVFVPIDFEKEKTIWKNLISEYQHLEENISISHPFFGNLNLDQLGVIAYKHCDHHLRQFGV